MKFTKIVSLILVAVLCLGVFACGPKKNDESSKAPETTKTPETTKAPEPTKTPETTKTPEAPETTEAPVITDDPIITDAPGTTEAPETPEPPKSTETPESTGDDLVPPSPEFGESLSAFLAQLTQMLDEAKVNVEGPDRELAAAIAAEIKATLQSVIDFELTDEVRTEIAKAALESLQYELENAGVTAEAVSAFIDEMLAAVADIYNTEINAELVDSIIAAAKAEFVAALVESGETEEYANGVADAQIAAILAYFDPADADNAKAMIAEMLADAREEIFATPGFPTEEELTATIEFIETTLLNVINGNVSDEEALDLFMMVEESVYALLNDVYGITPEMIDEAVANIKASLTEMLNAKVSKEEIDKSFEEAHASVDQLQSILFSIIGEGKDGKYTLTGIFASVIASQFEEEDNMSAEAVEAQIKAMIQQVIDFEMTDEVRLMIAQSYVESIKNELISAGLTIDVVNSMFGELEAIVDDIYNTEINAELVNGIIDELHAEFVNIYTDTIGGDAEDAVLYADAQINAILALWNPTDRDDAIDRIVNFLNSLKASAIEAGLTEDVVKTYTSAAKDLVTKIFTDGFTDEELIGFVKAYEQSIYAALEEAGITKEMLTEARAQFNAVLTTLLNAELSAKNIEDVFTALHAVIDFTESVFYTVVGEDTDGYYSTIDIFASFYATMVGGVAYPEEDIPDQIIVVA